MSSYIYSQTITLKKKKAIKKKNWCQLLNFREKKMHQQPLRTNKPPLAISQAVNSPVFTRVFDSALCSWGPSWVTQAIRFNCSTGCHCITATSGWGASLGSSHRFIHKGHHSWHESGSDTTQPPSSHHLQLDFVMSDRSPRKSCQFTLPAARKELAPSPKFHANTCYSTIILLIWTNKSGVKLYLIIILNYISLKQTIASLLYQPFRLFLGESLAMYQ